MTWRLDYGLRDLIAQWKAQNPGAVVGTIAGGGHVATWPATDHAPDPAHTVDAADFMRGNGVTDQELDKLADDLRRSEDDRIAYVIWDHMIMSSTIQAWKWRHYNGDDPHTDHVHVSVNETHNDESRPWKIGTPEKVTMEWIAGTIPVLKQGMSDPIDATGWYHIQRMQRLLKITDDGDYGPKTTAALKAWLKSKNIAGDGKSLNARQFKALAGIRG